jgi:hypothetical protein
MGRNDLPALHQLLQPRAILPEPPPAEPWRSLGRAHADDERSEEMTPDEKARIEKALVDFARDAVASREAARLALVKTGIFTRDGRLTPEYGGRQ